VANNTDSASDGTILPNPNEKRDNTNSHEIIGAGAKVPEKLPVKKVYKLTDDQAEQFRMFVRLEGKLRIEELENPTKRTKADNLWVQEELVNKRIELEKMLQRLKCAKVEKGAI